MSRIDTGIVFSEKETDFEFWPMVTRVLAARLGPSRKKLRQWQSPSRSILGIADLVTHQCDRASFDLRVSVQ